MILAPDILRLAISAMFVSIPSRWIVASWSVRRRTKQKSLAIIRAVVAMAESLNLSTTAEGVETEEELKLIQELGCKKIQGYYFGRPMLFADSLDLFKGTHSNVA